VAGTSTTGYRLNRQDRPTAAAEEFQASTTRAGQQLEQTSGDYQALDTKALALCGHALTTEPVVATEPPVCWVLKTVGDGAAPVAVAAPAVATVPATTALTISRAAGEAVTSSSARPMFRYSAGLNRETTSQPSPSLGSMGR
jgi:hypothetical protein